MCLVMYNSGYNSFPKLVSRAWPFQFLVQNVTRYFDCLTPEKECFRLRNYKSSKHSWITNHYPLNQNLTKKNSDSKCKYVVLLTKNMSVSLVTQFWVAVCAKIDTPQRQRWLNSIARSKLVTWQFFPKTSIFLPPSSCQQTSKHGKLIAASMSEQNEIWLSLFVFQKNPFLWNETKR